jgi:hypothetical protein
MNNYIYIIRVKNRIYKRTAHRKFNKENGKFLALFIKNHSQIPDCKVEL